MATATNSQMTIAVKADQAEGISDYIDLKWTSLCEELEHGDRRGQHTLIGRILDIAEACQVLQDGGTAGEITADRELLTQWVRDAGDYGRHEVASGLQGDYIADNQGAIRRGKALIALAQQEGLYEGVTV